MLLFCDEVGQWSVGDVPGEPRIPIEVEGGTLLKWLTEGVNQAERKEQFKAGVKRAYVIYDDDTGKVYVVVTGHVEFVGEFNLGIMKDRVFDMMRLIELKYPIPGVVSVAAEATAYSRIDLLDRINSVQMSAVLRLISGWADCKSPGLKYPIAEYMKHVVKNSYLIIYSYDGSQFRRSLVHGIHVTDLCGEVKISSTDFVMTVGHRSKRIFNALKEQQDVLM